LYLNVLAPRAPGKGRAVLVWIFGGALQFGHGGFPAYDGSAFAAREDIVYVSFNYRTNGKCLFISPQLDPSSVYLHVVTFVEYQKCSDLTTSKFLASQAPQICLLKDVISAFSINALP
jgi:hypothetical protein